VSKKPVFSDLLAFLIFFVLVGVYVYFQHLEADIPAIVSINPEIGNPGDILQIYGERFGDRKSYNCSVYIGNRRLVLSDYILWQDDKIQIKLPNDIKSGRLCVETDHGKSNTILFTNRKEIPVTVDAFHAPGMPYISDIISALPAIGDTIVIRGSGFGYEQGSGYVLFPHKSPAEDISGNQVREFAPVYGEFVYELWSDTEIRMHIPDGATTGSICVVTESGKSNLCHLEMYESSESCKNYASPAGYQISYDLAVHNFGNTKAEAIYVWLPEFLTYPEQHNVEIASDRETELSGYKGMKLFKFAGAELNNPTVVHNSAIFQRYSIKSDIDSNNIRIDYDTVSDFYKNYTKEDALIMANAQKCTLELKKISISKNPYIMARNIYNHLARQNRSNTLEYAMMFTAMARKSGIPARPVCGFVIDANNNVQIRYWAEFFIMGVGWLPVDVHDRAFCSLESDHITFSKGTVELPMINPEDHILKPKHRMYSIQNIYSEVAGKFSTVKVQWMDMKIVSRW